MLFTLFVDCVFSREGQEYDGDKFFTNYNTQCTRWETVPENKLDIPFLHPVLGAEYFPEDGSAENAKLYCRNPDGRESGGYIRHICIQC